MSIDEEMSIACEATYKFNQEVKEKAKIVAKHIMAMLKVGKENAMSRDDILVQLEHHSLPFELEEYIFRDAFGYLYETDVKTTNRVLHYLRKPPEGRDYGWY